MEARLNATLAAQTHGLTAITESIETSGCISWWRLSGGLDLTALRNAWDDAGLDAEWLPESPTPTAALRRAINELRGPTRLVRSLKGGSLALVVESEVNGELLYETSLVVGLDKVSRPAFSQVTFSHERDAVREAFQAHLENLTQGDVSPWLAGLMDHMQAVSLRDTGGVYFIPAFAMGTWARVLDALRDSTKHVISCVPALRSAEAATAVMDAIRIEAERSLEAIEKDVAAEALGERALRSRIVTTEAAEAKLSQYEDLFGAKLEAMHERLVALRGNLTIAVFKAQAEAEKRESA